MASPLIQKIAEELTQPGALADLEKFVQALLLKAMRQPGRDPAAKVANVTRLSFLSADIAQAIAAESKSPQLAAPPDKPAPLAAKTK